MFFCQDNSDTVDGTLSIIYVSYRIQNAGLKHIIEHVSTRNCSRCCGMAIKFAIFQQTELHSLTSFLLTSWCAFKIVFRIQMRANTTTNTRPRRQKMSTSPGLTSRETSDQHHRKLTQNVVRNGQETLLDRIEPHCTELNNCVPCYCRHNCFQHAMNNRHRIVRFCFIPHKEQWNDITNKYDLFL